MGSRSAYDVVFADGSPSPVPDAVRRFTRKFDEEAFVTGSQALANYLYDRQLGTVSSGLLAIMDVALGGRPGVVILKIERQEGFQLELAEIGGKATFALSILDNLVLTEGTRLFKAALFQRIGPGDGDFEAAASDSQKLVSQPMT